MSGFHKERLKTNIGVFFFIAAFLGLTVMMLVATLHFHNLPASKEQADALGVASYFSGTESDKQMIVLILAAGTLLCLLGALLFVRYFKKSYYMRSFTISDEGVESFFKKDSEGMVAYSDIQQKLLLRFPKYRLVANMAYKSSADQQWRVVPSRVFKSEELLETLENKTSEQILARFEKALAAEQSVAVHYFTPKNYPWTFTKLFRKINYSLSSKQFQEVKAMIEENLMSIDLSAAGLKVAETFIPWDRLNVEVLRDKADRIPKSLQKEHEYDSLCSLMDGDQVVLQLQSSFIVNRTSFLQLLQKRARNYSYAER